MKLKEFLEKINDGEGAVHVLAIDVLEGMKDGDFRELAADMQGYVDDEARTWARDLSMEEFKH